MLFYQARIIQTINLIIMKRLLLVLTGVAFFSIILSAQEKGKEEEKQAIKNENVSAPDEIYRKVVELPLTPEGSRAIGDDCSSPIIISVPAQLPYNVTGQTNCGRGNTYNTSCLGNYDGGEDIMYRLDATVNATITITMNPGASGWTGMYLSSTCGNSATCMAISTGSSGIRTISNQAITAGNSYYIMVDTWPSPNCIPSFSLNIVQVMSNPGSFTATTAGTSQINLNFTPNSNNNNVVIVWNNTGTFTTPSGTPIVGSSLAGGTVLYIGTSSPQVHTSLPQGTTFYYKAFSYAGSDYSSGLTANATTFCNLFTTFPLIESFNGTTFPPTCWITAKTAGTSTPGTWDRQTAGTYPTCVPHSGSGMTRFYSFGYGSGTKGILVSPPLKLSFHCNVKFWMYRDPGYASSADLVNVYYNTTNNLTGATLLGTINRSMSLAPAVASQGWYEYSFNLPPGSIGNNRFVIFEGVSAYGNNIFLDDIEIFYDPNWIPISNWALILAAGLIVGFTVFMFRRRS
jgi:hypothetical protein